ncbi:SpoIIE family protein phosphatase [Streptomyces sp.]|uniref:SpoIIE family protein phosphatase n=1 Tax=Streptomyces sp. TaxID=1931 RepID=UPI002F3E2414
MTVEWYDTTALSEAHERLLAGRPVTGAVRSPILASWLRCRSLGITADHVEVPFFEDLEFGGRLSEAAGPVLDRLESELSGMRATVLLSDDQARLLHRRVGDPAMNRYLDALRLTPGFAVPEEITGTNGIGTALANRRPAFVRGREHYADAMRGLACAAAPVRDPLSGRALGVLDLTCLDRYADPAMMTVALGAAKDIEQRLLDRVTSRERLLLEAFREKQRLAARGAPWTNDPAGDLLDRHDRLILEECATELISSGHSTLLEVPLTRGRTAALLSRPVESPSGVAGFTVEIALVHDGHDGRPAPGRVSRTTEQAVATAHHPPAATPSAPGAPHVPAADPKAPAAAPGALAATPKAPTAHTRTADAPAADVPAAAPRTPAVPDVPTAPTDRWLLAVGEPGIGRLALRARQRLGLVCEAGVRVGTTLDVVRTAEELTDVVVPLFADFAAVDLPDSVARGEEPIRVDGALRRAAIAGAHDASHLYTAGDLVVFAPSTPQARSLASGEPVLESALAEASGWMAQDPVRGRRILDAGVHSLITVPMLARGTVLGVVSFYRSTAQEPFEEDDLSLAEELVGRAAVCIDNARRFTREHATALALQRSLLPRGLPAQHAVEAAHRYLPAQSGVGGDWFDVIPLSGARVALVVGDVVGHGLHAAATMGRLRTAVHNFSALDLPVEEVLTHLDDLVNRLDLDQPEAANGGAGIIGASCLYAVYDPITRRCTLGRAGHPPPALVHPDGTVEIPDLPAGPPLGLGGLPFETTEIEVPEGSLLVLYTDGLIDHLGDRDVDRGIERLRHTLARPGRTPEQTCEALEALLTPDPADDVAMLVARTRVLNADHVAAWDVPADPAVVSRVRADVTARLAEWGLQELQFTTELMASELVTNAIRYGGPPVQLRLLRDRALICEVSDGANASPRLRRARTTDEGGRGLFLVAQLAQRWGTRYTPNGKVIWTEQPLPSR